MSASASAPSWSCLLASLRAKEERKEKINLITSESSHWEDRKSHSKDSVFVMWMVTASGSLMEMCWLLIRTLRVSQNVLSSLRSTVWVWCSDYWLNRCLRKLACRTHQTDRTSSAEGKERNGMTVIFPNICIFSFSTPSLTHTSTGFPAMRGCCRTSAMVSRVSWIRWTSLESTTNTTPYDSE